MSLTLNSIKSHEIDWKILLSKRKRREQVYVLSAETMLLSRLLGSYKTYSKERDLFTLFYQLNYDKRQISLPISYDRWCYQNPISRETNRYHE